MEPPAGLPVPAGSLLRLNKTLYGLKQSPREWNALLHDWLESQGLRRSRTDPCLYTKALDDGHDLYLTVWIDDFRITSQSAAALTEFKAAISDKFKMKDLGLAHHCVGMRIRQDVEAGTVQLDQEHYVKELLSRYNMRDCRPVSTPLPAGCQLEVDGPAKDSTKANMRRLETKRIPAPVPGVLYTAGLDGGCQPAFSLHEGAAPGPFDSCSSCAEVFAQDG